MEDGVGIWSYGPRACLEQNAPSIPVTIVYIDALTAQPSTEAGALLKQRDLHRRVLARKVEGSGETGYAATKNHDVAGFTVLARHGSPPR